MSRGASILRAGFAGLLLAAATGSIMASAPARASEPPAVASSDTSAVTPDSVQAADASSDMSSVTPDNGPVTDAAPGPPAPPNPPDTMVLSKGGVDLRSGFYKVDKTLLSIGPSQLGGIDFRRITRAYGLGEPIGKMAQFDHNWNIRFRRKSRKDVGVDVFVTIDQISYTFYDGGGPSATLTSSTDYATLTRTTTGGSNYYYTLKTANGTTVVSRNVDPSITLAASVSRANGVSYTLNYDALGPSGDPRLRSVVSNAGYALVLEYTPNSNGNSFVSKACVLNLALAVLPPTNICPAGAHAVSYTYSTTHLTSETDANGAVWGFTDNYTNAGTAFQNTYTLPGASAPYLTVNYDWAEGYQLAALSQVFADGRRFDYSWTAVISDQAGDVEAIIPYYYIENSALYTFLTYDTFRQSVYTPLKVAPGPSSVGQPGIGTTSFNYCLSTCSEPILRSRTLPSGITANYTYDSYFHHIIKTVTTPVAGSPLPALTTTATFDCTTLLSCDSPTSTVDANGNESDYTYSPVHGQILTATAPAVGGIRPQTRYTYAQRYAWIANGSGGYVHAASPVWVLTQESYCKTGAAAGAGCAVAGDEVITTYDYGPDSGPNTLVLRGKVIDAGGLALRSCSGYDSWGRKISETAPNAGLGSCP